MKETNQRFLFILLFILSIVAIGVLGWYGYNSFLRYNKEEEALLSFKAVN